MRPTARSMKRSYDEASLDGQQHPNGDPDLPPVVAAPKISKARACAECKRHKIKCEMKPGESSCTKCTRAGIKCVANDFSQRFVVDDVAWKAQATATMQQLQGAVSHILSRNHLPQLSTFESDPTPPTNRTTHVGISQAPAESRASANTISTMNMTRENSQEPSEQPELVPAPIHSLYEVTKLRNLRSQLEKPKSNLLEEDFVSRGYLTLHEAEELFAYFSRTVNQLLWGGIILVHPDLNSVRRASSMLAAVILTIAALHIPNRTDTLNICYNEFVSLVSSASLTRHHTLDDIRALCIGAFWLPDLSWKLSGQAVRIATEMNLHQSFQKLTRGAADQYESAQLWYLLYVCDHHFSIAYGRPPSIHEDFAIKNYETYLQSPFSGPGDTRLVAQVALFIVLTDAYRMYGCNSEQALTEADFAQLRAFNVAIEQWRLLWQPRSPDSPYVRTYPSKGVVLHHHFAKFQLNSLALRAISPGIPFSTDRKEAANIAVSSAIATLNLVLEDPDVRDAIIGVPIFTHTMVTFSAVFLLKVAVIWDSEYVNIDARQVQHLVERVIDLISSASAGEKHLTRHIARGLGKMLERFKHETLAISPGNITNADGAVGGVNGTGVPSTSGLPLPDMIISDMVGAYGFNLDESFLDPYITGYGYFPT